MLSEFLGWVIIILPVAIIIYLVFYRIQSVMRHRKDCDNSTGRQKELNNLLFRAVDEGNIEKAQKAIADGADVNVRGLGGKTPLIRVAHRAADPKCYHDEANLAIAKLLVEKGADLNIQDLFGGRAIGYCDLDLPGSSPQIAELLQTTGAQGFPRASSREQSGL